MWRDNVIIPFLDESHDTIFYEDPDTLSEARMWNCGDQNSNIIATLEDDGTLKISGKGKMRDFKFVQPPWSKIDTLIISLVIEEGVTHIGDRAFFNCTNLTSVMIPSSMITIGEAAFHNCTALMSIMIPGSVTKIGRFAFLGCTDLTSITVATDNAHYSFEDGVLFNKDKTFLIQYLPSRQSAFYTIPSSVTSIGNFAFSNCISLTSLRVAVDNTHYSSENGILFNKNKTSLLWYLPGRQSTYKIPYSVTKINGLAFEDCIGLMSIAIPGSVVSIGYNAFRNCTSLTSVIIQNPEPPEFYAFENIDKNNVCLYVPVGSIDVYRKSSIWGRFNCIYEIVEEVKVVPWPTLIILAVLILLIAIFIILRKISLTGWLTSR
jgi:hypothetical protein